MLWGDSPGVIETSLRVKKRFLLVSFRNVSLIQNLALPLFSLFFYLHTFMEKKPTPDEPVEKTNKCSLYSGKEPKTNGNAQNNRPKPEPSTSERQIIL
jgi:hypothetical protein